MWKKIVLWFPFHVDLKEKLQCRKRRAEIKQRQRKLSKSEPAAQLEPRCERVRVTLVHTVSPSALPETPMSQSEPHEYFICHLREAVSEQRPPFDRTAAHVPSWKLSSFFLVVVMCWDCYQQYVCVFIHTVLPGCVCPAHNVTCDAFSV